MHEMRERKHTNDTMRSRHQSVNADCRALFYISITPTMTVDGAASKGKSTLFNSSFFYYFTSLSLRTEFCQSKLGCFQILMKLDLLFEVRNTYVQYKIMY